MQGYFVKGHPFSFTAHLLMRSLKEQIWHLLTKSFLRPLEAFNKMSAFVKGDQVSQGLLCNSILLLVTPEYSVTWEEISYFPQPRGYFLVIHPRMAFFCCLLMVYLSTRTPRSFSAKHLSIQLTCNLYCHMGLFYLTMTFLKSVSFLTALDSNPSRILWARSLPPFPSL